MSKTRLEEWEARLQAVFDEIDARLEEGYGSEYPLHPVRVRRGDTGNPRHDGLFDVHAAFSAGFGSEHGPGYVLSVRMATLSDVHDHDRDEIMDEAVRMLRERLPAAFPERDLTVRRDGSVYKIIGNLDL